MLKKQPLSSKKIPGLWSAVMKLVRIIDLAVKPSMSSDGVFHLTPSNILEPAYSFVFLKAYILLEDIEKSCLNNGKYYFSEQDRSECRRLRNLIAHNKDKTITGGECKKLLGYIEAELKYWKLI